MIACSEESYQATLRRLEQIIEFLAQGNYSKAMRVYKSPSRCAFCRDAFRRLLAGTGLSVCEYCVWTNNGLNPRCGQLCPPRSKDLLPLALAAYGYLVTWEKV